MTEYSEEYLALRKREERSGNAAFPQLRSCGDGGSYTHEPGLTRKEFFAAHALAGMLARENPRDAARHAWEAACELERLIATEESTDKHYCRDCGKTNCVCGPDIYI